MMRILTDDFVLRTVSEADIGEIARMWNFFSGGVSVEEAYRALDYMTKNHERNAKGIFYHLCLAVCRKEATERILGWCGLDGKENAERPELFVLLHEEARGTGCGTQCTKGLLDYAFGVVGLKRVHGSCAPDNFASARMMEKAGMVRYGTGEDGAPLFITDGKCD